MLNDEFRANVKRLEAALKIAKAKVMKRAANVPMATEIVVEPIQMHQCLPLNLINDAFWFLLMFLKTILFLCFLNKSVVLNKGLSTHFASLTILMKVERGEYRGLNDIDVDYLKPISKALKASSVHNWVTRGTLYSAMIGCA